MRVGQTSAVVFLAKLASSVFGFAATVYFARVLGPEVYGIYALIIAVAAWLRLFGEVGISTAVKKRISEGSQRGEYLAAGLVWLAAFTLVLAVVVVLTRNLLEAYLSGWSEYVAVSVVWFLLGMLAVRLALSFVQVVLEGEKRVHVAGLLDPVRTGLRSAFQIALVFAGLHLVGMLVGYILGIGLAAAVGLAYVTIRPRLPDREHVRSLFDYAKFSWLGSLKSRTYQDVDLLVLGALVPGPLVGVYAIAWSFIRLLKLFGQAVSRALFPEISERSTQEGPEAAAGLVEDGLAYGGFIAIPGAVGGAMLAERLLLIHGPEYLRGTEVLWLLLLGVVFWAYMRQCLNALNALDRSDLAFRVTLVFVATNLTLNVALVLEVGWVGAAIASVASTAFGFALAYTLLGRVTPVTFPRIAVAQQVVAAVAMGLVIIALDAVLWTTGLLPHPVLGLPVLVPAGVAAYMAILFVIAPDFRRTLQRNLPVDIPLLDRLLRM